jgi:predicted ester cyclase
MRQAADVIRAAVPDWRSDTEHLIAEGDLVVEHFHAYGTRTGELLGTPADGSTLTLRGMHIFRIAGDKIVERWGRLDDLGLQQQLGGG